jgi:hypothetical protein
MKRICIVGMGVKFFRRGSLAVNWPVIKKVPSIDNN